MFDINLPCPVVTAVNQWNWFALEGCQLINILAQIVKNFIVLNPFTNTRGNACHGVVCVLCSQIIIILFRVPCCERTYQKIKHDHDSFDPTYVAFLLLSLHFTWKTNCGSLLPPVQPPQYEQNGTLCHAYLTEKICRSTLSSLPPPKTNQMRNHTSPWADWTQKAIMQTKLQGAAAG